MSPLPPSHLLDLQDSVEKGPFGTTHSPSELHVKVQDKEYDDLIMRSSIINITALLLKDNLSLMGSAQDSLDWILLTYCHP